nr:hypothetical protein [Nanoarchaeota archaeon]
MTKLKIKERIEEEETRKLKPLFIGVILIFIISILLNIVLKISLLIKIISGIVLLILVIYLGIEWYRAYYK